MQQLPLSLRWPTQQRFETYVSNDNGANIALLQRAVGDANVPWVFLVGVAGSGKTHLLIAACAASAACGRGAQYLPLARLREEHAAAIRALGGNDVLALDDVDKLAGDREAEHALFDLYNRCKEEKSTLIFSATRPPAQLGIGLPDLVSRLASCNMIMLKPLSESERREALRQRAQIRGITLDDNVLDWLFARTQRDLGSLTAILDRLDRASLAAKRRITVPFLRQLLGGES